ncbi:hypothetical protein [Paenibacillus tepidiphilus]|uniref:hypothetical protein n=1 Tax=Paenibacillus tepidiphilus TaxID=2608683 RepID=UPI00123ACEDF|nr:hypothetical protein [Paenibacillus tepidiphilus]
MRKVMLKKASALLLMFCFMLSPFSSVFAATAEASADDTPTTSAVEIQVAYPDGTIMDQGVLYVALDDESYSTYTSFGENGVFLFDLPDGTYNVSGVTDFTSWESITFYDSFTVSGGNAQTYTLQLPPKIVGSIVTADGADLPYGRLYLTGSDGSTTNGYVTNVDDGAFSLYLPDGTYTADFLSEWNHMWAVTLHSSFTVTGGQVEQTPLVITVPLQYTGTVTKNGAPLSSAVVYFQSTDDSSISYEGRVMNGNLSVFLLNGNYHIDKVLDLNTSQEYNVNLNVTVEDGAVVPGGPLTITIP